MTRLILGFFWVLLCGIVLLAAVPSAVGQSCGYSYRSYSSYSTPSYSYSYEYKKPDYYFTKFVAAIPLIEFPTYSAVYVPTAVQASPAPAVSAPVAAPVQTPVPVAPAAAPSPSCADKSQQILDLLRPMAQKMDTLDARVRALEARIGVTPPPESPMSIPAPPMTTPKPAAAPEKPDGPSILHSRCASCHDAKTVAREKAKVTLFAEGAGGPEMATVNASGGLEPLTLTTLKKVERVLVDGTMPPEKHADGKPSVGLAAVERKDALEFIRRAIAGGAK